MSAATKAADRHARAAATPEVEILDPARPAYKRALADVQRNTRPTTLDMLKIVRQARDQTPTSLAAVTGLTVDRIRQLENAVGIQEPWLDEAAILSRCLGLAGITPLITSGDLTLSPMGVPMPEDIDAFRAGFRLPLSLACRLCVKFGLDDPMHLVTTPLHRQVWDILERNERGAAPGACAWCLADLYEGNDHLPTCMPHNLWGRRDHDRSEIAILPRPARGIQRRGTSATAKGLKPLRERLCLTQAIMAAAVGMDSNHLARVERLINPLTQGTAERIAAVYGVSVGSLYQDPSEQGA